MIQREINKIHFKSRFHCVCSFPREGVPESRLTAGKKPYPYLQPNYANVPLICQRMSGNT